jgi:hypothetical protein
LIIVVRVQLHDSRIVNDPRVNPGEDMMIRSVDDTGCSAVVGKLVGGGGGMGIRTPDPDLAKVVLYQLSYAPGRVEPIVS